MPKVTAEVSIVPIGTGDTGISAFVAEAVKALEKVAESNGLRYHVCAMGTAIEGELDLVWQAVRVMQEAMFNAGAKRLITTLRVDDRRDKEETLERKREAVLKRGLKLRCCNEF